VSTLLGGRVKLSKLLWIRISISYEQADPHRKGKVKGKKFLFVGTHSKEKEY
jgi:hypothetical protein